MLDGVEYLCCAKLPGRSRPSLGVANPFGNLRPVSILVRTLSKVLKRTVVRDLLVMLDRHFVVIAIKRSLGVEVEMSFRKFKIRKSF